MADEPAGAVSDVGGAGALAWQLDIVSLVGRREAAVSGARLPALA